MDIKINLDILKDLENKSLKIDKITFQKMVLLYNTIEQGWSVKKRNQSYIFKKRNEGTSKVFEESYLMNFINSKLDIKNLININ